MTDLYITDYNVRYFEYKTLEKFHGQPTIETLIKIFRQLKINAQCVPTTLGGG